MLDAAHFTYLFSLLAALLYACAALLIKRSSDLGAGVWRTAFLSNLIIAVLFQPLLILGGTVHWDLWWQPVLVAICFIAGQWFTFLSLDKGDVSVATPVLGIKVLLVALFTTLLGSVPLGMELWIAAALATVGIALLNRRTTGTHHHVGRTILTATMAAASFALFDVLVQTWSPDWGLGVFLPISIGISGFLTLAFIPYFEAPLSHIQRNVWPWLIAGTLAMAGQSILFVSTIAAWGLAAPANVIYSSRGLWSILLVWLIGHWVSSREQHHGRAVLAWRMAGALLMMSAIILVLVFPKEKPEDQENVSPSPPALSQNAADYFAMDISQTEISP